METLTTTKQGANQERWRRVAKDKALALLLPRIIIETPGELLLKMMQLGTVSTNWVFFNRRREPQRAGLGMVRGVIKGG